MTNVETKVDTNLQNSTFDENLKTQSQTTHIEVSHKSCEWAYASLLEFNHMRTPFIGYDKHGQDKFYLEIDVLMKITKIISCGQKRINFHKRHRYNRKNPKAVNSIRIKSMPSC